VSFLRGDSHWLDLRNTRDEMEETNECQNRGPAASLCQQHWPWLLRRPCRSR
jgi:hypothetical protein